MTSVRGIQVRCARPNDLAWCAGIRRASIRSKLGAYRTLLKPATDEMTLASETRFFIRRMLKRFTRVLVALVLGSLSLASAYAQELAPTAGPRQADYLNSRGVRHFEDQQYDLAVTTLEQAFMVAPGNETIRGNLLRARWKAAEQLHEEGKTEEAIEKLVPALELAPEDPTLLVYIATLQISISHHRLAAPFLEEALAAKPAFGDAWYLLGEVHYYDGMLDHAILDWEQAAREGPSENQSRVQERIAKARRELKVESGFKSDERGHFALRFSSGEMNSVALTVSRILEDLYYELGGQFGLFPKVPVSPIPVILYDAEQFTEVTEVQEHIGALFDGKIRLKITPDNRQDIEKLRQMAAHEYVHLLIYLLAGGKSPFWLNEGLAQYHSETWTQSHSSRYWEWVGSASAKYPVTLADLDEDKLNLSDPEFAEAVYVKAFAAGRYLRNRFTREEVTNLLSSIRAGRKMSDALQEVLGLTYEQFEIQVAQTNSSAG